MRAKEAKKALNKAFKLYMIGSYSFCIVMTIAAGVRSVAFRTQRFTIFLGVARYGLVGSWLLHRRSRGVHHRCCSLQAFRYRADCVPNCPFCDFHDFAYRPDVALSLHFEEEYVCTILVVDPTDVVTTGILIETQRARLRFNPSHLRLYFCFSGFGCLPTRLFPHYRTTKAQQCTSYSTLRRSLLLHSTVLDFFCFICCSLQAKESDCGIILQKLAQQIQPTLKSLQWRHLRR